MNVPIVVDCQIISRIGLTLRIRRVDDGIVVLNSPSTVLLSLVNGAVWVWVAIFIGYALLYRFPSHEWWVYALGAPVLIAVLWAVTRCFWAIRIGQSKLLLKINSRTLKHSGPRWAEIPRGDLRVVSVRMLPGGWSNDDKYRCYTWVASLGCVYGNKGEFVSDGEKQSIAVWIHLARNNSWACVHEFAVRLSDIVNVPLAIDDTAKTKPGFLDTLLQQPSQEVSEQ